MCFVLSLYAVLYGFTTKYVNLEYVFYLSLSTLV